MKEMLSILMLFLLSINYEAMARRQIDIHQNGQMPTHFDLPIPADMPEVYYDNDTHEIIIEADGFSSYYDVDIYPENSTIPVLWDTVNGIYDTVDVSSLVPDEYHIVITSEYNNVYEGYFIVE